MHTYTKIDDLKNTPQEHTFQQFLEKTHPCYTKAKAVLEHLNDLNTCETEYHKRMTGISPTMLKRIETRKVGTLSLEEMVLTDWLNELTTKVIAPKKTKKNTNLIPFMPEGTRCVPNIAIRSALFSVSKRGTKRIMEHEPVCSQGDIKLFCTGFNLDQDDLDVWEMALLKLSTSSIPDRFMITSYEYLKRLGKENTGGKNSNRDILHRRLLRLASTVIEVEHHGISYAGHLIDEVVHDETTKAYIIKVNQKLVSLFEKDQYTIVDWTIRQDLTGHLAKWLHNNYASHAKPYPVKIETLRDLCGSETSLLKTFKQKLIKALDTLKAAYNAHDQYFNYWFEGDLLHVEREPSASQERHLTKKKPPR